jgi:GT2 family glycosyltransferase
MKVSVILIAYGGDRWLPACLDTLSESSTLPLHLVLVDNAANTILDELDLSAFETEVLSTPEPMGFAEANNFALMKSNWLAETVLFLNQDTKSPSAWVDECTRLLEARPELGAVSPCIRTYEGDGWDPSFLACLSEKQEANLRTNSIEEKVLFTQSVPAPALLVHTDVLKKTGPFDSVYGSYYEDYDLCRRIRRRGFSVGFCTNAHIQHFSGGSTTTEEQKRRRMRQVVRNRVLYELREGETARWRAVLNRFLRDFPRRLARGLAGTPSSQPPVVTLKAYGDLLRLGRRIVSSSYDEKKWRQYLADLGWPPRSMSTSPAAEKENWAGLAETK